MTRRSPGLVAGLALLVAGCSRPAPEAPPRPAAPAPGPATAASVAPSAAVSTSAAIEPGSPAAPPPLAGIALLRSAVAVEPAARVALAPGAETVVHPAASFEVELSARAADARLVLVDARDDLVPATATREVGAGTRLTLAPAAPLVPASRYTLRIDGASDRPLHDDAGRAFAPVTLPLLAAGAPPPPEAKRPARKRHRRR